jgi:hypothetical protein
VVVQRLDGRLGDLVGDRVHRRSFDQIAERHLAVPDELGRFGPERLVLLRLGHRGELVAAGGALHVVRCVGDDGFGGALAVVVDLEVGVVGHDVAVGEREARAAAAVGDALPANDPVVSVMPAETVSRAVYATSSLALRAMAVSPSASAAPTVLPSLMATLTGTRLSSSAAAIGLPARLTPIAFAGGVRRRRDTAAELDGDECGEVGGAEARGGALDFDEPGRGPRDP